MVPLPQSVHEARRAEERFFASRPEYGELVGRCGTGRLAVLLNGLLAEHIRRLLPDLRRQVRRQGLLYRLRSCVNVLPRSSAGS